MARKSWFNAGEYATDVVAALDTLEVPGVHVGDDDIIWVRVPDGVQEDEHQDALADFANAIVEATIKRSEAR